MAKIENELHERILTETIEKFKSEGYRMIRLQAKCPDAIATKDGKLIAIEVLGKYGKERDYKLQSGWTYTSRKKEYSMFDDVKIITFPISYRKFPHEEGGLQK